MIRNCIIYVSNQSIKSINHILLYNYARNEIDSDLILNSSATYFDCKWFLQDLIFKLRRSETQGNQEIKEFKGRLQYFKSFLIF